MKRIGLLYIKGSLPAFEDFGNLPTDIIKKNGMVRGIPAHKVLDGVIIPGGSIIESGTITPEIEKEIKKIAEDGGFVLGICSGFQVLGKKTDVGRRSPIPIWKKGIGLLDVKFEPLINNDRVKAKIVGDCFLTKGLINKTIEGFHCHTYGKITTTEKPIFCSILKRTNYKDKRREVISGVSNDDGNVVGTLIHGCLDYNPELVDNIFSFLDLNEKEIIKIKEENKKLKNKIKREIGVDTNIFAKKKEKNSKNTRFLMIAGISSGAGKTFITTGLAGVLRKKGFDVGIAKVGPDVRDITPALYLTKEKMGKYSSIKIGHLGWMELKDVINHMKRKFDIVLIEGVMSILTGMLNEKVPYSAVEIAMAANIPVILVEACNKAGIETATLNLISHAKLLEKLGIKVKGIILNKVYDENIVKRINLSNFNGYVFTMPKVILRERKSTPEVEISLENFSLKALEVVEKNIDINKIIKAAENVKFEGYVPLENLVERVREFIDDYLLGTGTPRYS